MYFCVCIASTQVVLTVQQKPASSATGLQVGPLAGQQPLQQQHQRPASLSAGTTMVSPTQQTASSLHRASTAPAGSSPLSCNARITGPQPVDVSRTEFGIVTYEPLCPGACSLAFKDLNITDTLLNESHNALISPTRTLNNSLKKFFLTRHRTSPWARRFTTPTSEVRLFFLNIFHVCTYVCLYLLLCVFIRDVRSLV